MTTPTLPPETAPPPGTAPRIVALDVLRGLALIGIAFVNVEPVTGFRYELPTLADPSGWLQLFVQQRFFPLFSLLFGIGFALLFASAERRGANARLVLLRRLLLLAPVGVLHQLVHPGEALTPYAVVGLVVLLPSTWAPRRFVAGAGAVVFLAALLGLGGGLALIPGLFLIGAALVRYDLVAHLEAATRVPLLLFVGFALVAVPTVLIQSGDVAGSGFTTVSGVAGAALAGVYATGLLLALRTPLRRVLVTSLAPLGRMALTNYLTATAVMVAARGPLHLQDSTSWPTVLGLAGGILLAQALLSAWWLRRFRLGPLEWLWRWGTWGRRPALVRWPAPAGAEPPFDPQAGTGVANNPDAENPRVAGHRAGRSVAASAAG